MLIYIPSIFLAAVIALSGCVVEPSVAWADLDPPPQYHPWYQEVEACTGVERSFEAIQWRKVYAPTFPCPGLGEAAGCFIYPRTIYLVEHLLDQEWLVKAELIHYVRQDTAHDATFSRCGGA